MFKKILIANRGEIARRIIRTCRKMGIKTVAVYSEADVNSLHVSEADEAVFIGPSPSSQSYLNIENIIDAVLQTGADAVHPGYGFLSERAEFAERLAKINVKFIGPFPKAISYMGDKIEAKKHAEAAGVSVVPGFKGEIKDEVAAAEIAEKIGFPVMMKAAAGGGGKGMRIVYKKEEVPQAFKSTTNEARKSFGDERIFIEKFIENPRHIEIQIIGDEHGNVVCLGERECSIQRNNQKVIEEAPSPIMDDKTRAEMYRQSVALAKLVGYANAGTVEYIMDQNKNFYFLEINTRLQVEHPVTEFVTGLDLVELMIKIASGEKLPFKQSDIKLSGWAMESRIYAEDPSRGFLPSTGRITEYKEPEKSENVRVDSGIYAGGEVSMFYDAMVAKLITYGKTRLEAIDRQQTALSEYVVSGISNNIDFLEAIMEHPRFREGRLSTKFIADEYPQGFSGAVLNEHKTKVMLCAGLFIYLKDAFRAARISGQVPGRSRKIPNRWVVAVDDQKFNISYEKKDEITYLIDFENQTFEVQSEFVLGSKLWQGVIDGVIANVRIEHIDGGFILTHMGSKSKVSVRTPRIAELEKYLPKEDKSYLSKDLIAPISGAIVDIKVQVGQVVNRGQDVAILEAMKMENILYADRDAIVDQVLVKKGDNVSVNQVLIKYKESEKKD
ncbi:MAG: acetyl/propionyl/methylcrotonyl-CoA carboxylase subunit alpha [Rickettsiales bacterium]|nr:acetyl/propionyl/methylcrotonyl-CoA carboxylase subunit alpha [Rickettsiales bacterium]